MLKYKLLDNYIVKSEVIYLEMLKKYIQKHIKTISTISMILLILSITFKNNINLNPIFIFLFFLFLGLLPEEAFEDE